MRDRSIEAAGMTALVNAFRTIRKTLSSGRLFVCGLALAGMLSVGTGKAEVREWSEPIELTDVRNWGLDYEFEVALDSRGNIHLLYSVNFFEDAPGDRLLYSVFNPEGQQIGERFCRWVSKDLLGSEH